MNAHSYAPPAVYVESDGAHSIPAQVIRLYTDATAGSRDDSPITYVRELVIDGRQMRLRRPLKLETERTEDGISIFVPLLHAGGHGATYRDAIADTADTIWRLWLEFRDEEPERLHESALRMRKSLALIFGE